MLKTENGKHFSFEYIGEFYTEKDWIHPTAFLENFELIFMLKGTAYIEEDGIKYELHENDMLILEPSKIHKGYKTSNETTSFYWFHYKTDMALPFKYLTGAEIYTIKSLLKQLLHHAHTIPVDPLTTDSVALLIYTELLRCNSQNGKDNAFLHKVYEYSRINAVSATVKDIAIHFGYNTDYISRIFKKRFKIGLKEFLNSCKLELARDMLLTTELSVKEISSKLHFDNENAFIKFFIYHEKISPRTFRDRFYNTFLNNR